MVASREQLQKLRTEHMRRFVRVLENACRTAASKGHTRLVSNLPPILTEPEGMRLVIETFPDCVINREGDSITIVWE